MFSFFCISVSNFEVNKMIRKQNSKEAGKAIINTIKYFKKKA